MQAYLAGGSTALAILVKLTRTDGVVLGFTGAADSEITYDGLTYYPNDGATMTAVDSKTGTGIDNCDFTGILSSDRISETDILAGRYDAARISVYLVNRTDLTTGAVTLLSGFLGEVTDSQQDGTYNVEIRSLAQTLRQVAGDVTTNTCRCKLLGDAQCKLNLAGNTVSGAPIEVSLSVVSVINAKSISFASTNPTNFYLNGVITFTSGANAGIAREIKYSTLSAPNNIVVLRRTFPYVIEVGDVATLQAGCDRLIATCGNTFNNSVNFHGEPSLPGNTQVLASGSTSS
jgi:uncharacterized phage protein (TIGR02218 family)